MKKTEKFIAAVTTIALGVLLVVLRGDMIRIITSTLGIMIVVLGVLDFFKRDAKIAIAKCVIGILTLLFGFFALKAILYIIAAGLIILGIWWFYDWIKDSCPCPIGFSVILFFAKPILLIAIGVLLCFNQGGEWQWVFVVTGILTVIEGGILFAEWIYE